MKYRIPGELIIDVYIDIEADSPEEAWNIANESDKGLWLEDQNGGCWEIGDVCLVSESPIEDDDLVNSPFICGVCGCDCDSYTENPETGNDECSNCKIYNHG